MPAAALRDINRIANLMLEVEKGRFLGHNCVV
jgi:hypothetical protein